MELVKIITFIVIALLVANAVLLAMKRVSVLFFWINIACAFAFLQALKFYNSRKLKKAR